MCATYGVLPYVGMCVQANGTYGKMARGLEVKWVQLVMVVRAGGRKGAGRGQHLARAAPHLTAPHLVRQRVAPLRALLERERQRLVAHRGQRLQEGDILHACMPAQKKVH